MTVRDLVSLIRETFNHWLEDRAPRLGAALAYYSIFALAPLVIIAVAVAGLFFGEAAANGRIRAEVQGTVGPGPAKAIEDMVAHTHSGGDSLWATVVGLATLFIGAAGFFGQLQDALNTIWKVKAKPGRSWGKILRERFLPFLMVVGTGFFLLLSLVISAGLAAVSKFLSPESLPRGLEVWKGVNAAASLGIITLLFAVIYKYLPDVRIHWGDVWMGAVVTSVLFVAGRFLLGYYLGCSSVTSAYGAAGSLVLILLWVYYSSQLFLFGAEFTRVYAMRRGSRVVPSANAIPLSPEALTQQGIPSHPGGAATPTGK